MAALRIGVNSLYLIPGGVGGTEIYLRRLLGALAEIDDANEYSIFVNRETGPDLAPSAPNFRVIRQPVRAVIRPARIVWEQTGLPIAAARRRIDVMLNPGFTAPILGACPSVTVFHDLQHKRHPEYFRWFDLPFWRVLLWAAAHRSRLLLADSDATRRDLLHYYRIEARKVRVAPLGVDPEFFEIGAQRAGRLHGNYVLCASTSHPHKNLGPLIRAFFELRRRRPDLALVITGVRGFHADELERLIRELKLETAVRLTGWIPREDLYALFRDALAFACPSTFEGFGLPLIEALAAGIPTACSAIEPLKSAAGDAALLFDPGDPGEMLAALERVISDETLRARLAAAGPRRAAHYSWRKTAEVTLAALVEAASTG